MIIAVSGSVIIIIIIIIMIVIRDYEKGTCMLLDVAM
jgi:hypothetical protein